MEAVPVPRAEIGTERLTRQRRVGLNPTQAPSDVGRVPRSRILGQRDEQAECEAWADEQDQQAHRSDTLRFSRAQCLHDVESDGLVLDLLDEVPRQERPDLLFLDLGHRRTLAAERVLRDDRSPVFDRRRDRELSSPRKPASDPVEQHARAVHEPRRIAHGAQDFVETLVLSLVHRLLSDERVRLLPEIWVVDIGPVPLDRVDDEPLTFRDDRREQRHQVTGQKIALGEVPLTKPVTELELGSSGRDRPTRDGALGMKLHGLTSMS